MRTRELLWSLWGALLLAALGMAAEEAKPYGIVAENRPEAEMLAAGQPSAEQLVAIAKDGYRTVLDLRTPEEDRGFDEKAAVEAAGMRYVNLPVSGTGLDQKAVDQFIGLLKNSEKPIFVHCASANRVGALYAAYLVLEQGLPRQEALERGRKAGLRNQALEQKVTSLLDERSETGQLNATSSGT